MSEPPESLEDRVAYLEENIRVLNKASCDTARAIKGLISANQERLNDLSDLMQEVLDNGCPFPPECVAPGD